MSAPGGGAPEASSRVVHGPLNRALLSLAWPVLGALSLKMAFSLLDIYWVGRLGGAAVAALSTSAFLYWILMSVTEGVAVGTLALVARATGAGDRAEVVRVTGQALAWGLACGVAAGVAGWMVAPAAFALMAVPDEVAVLGVVFMRRLVLAAPFLLLFTTVDAVFRGLGRTRVSLLLYAAALALNAVLDPLLIFGGLGLPAMGVAGAATATGLAFTAGAVLALHLVAQELGGASALLRRMRPDPGTAARILRIGAAPAVNGILFCLVYVLLARVTSEFGTSALAALGLGHKIEGPSYLTAVALGQAAATMVGQCLGAGNAARARQAAWRAVGLASISSAAYGLLFLLAAPALVRFFVADPDVVAPGASYLRVIGIVLVFNAWEMVLDGAFGGAGHTLPPLVVGVPLTFARLPLADWLAHGAGLGLDGVWWAIALTAAAKGVVLALWFRRGGWARGGRLDTQAGAERHPRGAPARARLSARAACRPAAAPSARRRRKVRP